jgi:hypothetical protein
MIDTVNLEAIAEGDAHAAWIVKHHVGNGTERPRCVLCDEWWPCDELSLAALAVLRAREAERLREMLGIATETLLAIAKCGCSACGPTPRDLAHARTLADDALTNMSVVE